jgi:hypothetical protein
MYLPFMPARFSPRSSVFATVTQRAFAAREEMLSESLRLSSRRIGS